MRATTGHIGGTLAKLWVGAGHEVLVVLGLAALVRRRQRKGGDSIAQ